MSEIRVDTIKAEDGISSPSFPSGIQVTGVVTATVLDTTVPFLTIGNNAQLGNTGIITATGANISGNLSSVDGNFSGNVTIGGTLTYEDVTNIDSVGLVTARNGISVSSGGIKVLAGGSNFNATITGTATTATTITVSSDTTDTLCFPIFANTGVGNNAPKVNTSRLSFNSSSGQLTATSFAGSGSGITDIPAANLTGTASAINGSNITNLTAANLTGALPAISGANLTGIEGGKIRNYKHVVDAGYSAASWGSFTQIASFSYTPLQSDSYIYVIASPNFLWESSNVHNTRMKFGSNGYQQYNKTAKAASISGWLSGNPTIIFSLGQTGNTSSNAVLFEAQGTGSHTSYYNYSSAHSTFLLLEMAPEG